jgi:hypothetical protein
MRTSRRRSNSQARPESIVCYSRTWLDGRSGERGQALTTSSRPKPRRALSPDGPLEEPLSTIRTSVRLGKPTLHDLKAMGPGRFEDLVSALVMAAHPKAVRHGPPDGGADLFERLAGGTRVWQVKHHTAGVNVNKCMLSFQRALAWHRPVEFRFVFPTDITLPTDEKLQEEAAKFAPTVSIECIGGSRVLAMLRAYPEISNEFFGNEIEELALAIRRRLPSPVWYAGALTTSGARVAHSRPLETETGRSDKKTIVSRSTLEWLAADAA